MKSLILLTGSLVLLGGVGFAQVPPAMPGVAPAPSSTATSASLEGYEGLPWFAPTSAIVAKYPSLWYDPDKDPDFPNAVQGKVKYTSGAVKERTFVTVDNKLVKVIVDYNLANLDFEAMLLELIDRFGRDFERDTRKEMVSGTNVDVLTIRWETPKSSIGARLVSTAGHESFLMLYMSKEASKANRSIEF